MTTSASDSGEGNVDSVELQVVVWSRQVASRDESRFLKG